MWFLMVVLKVLRPKGSSSVLLLPGGDTYDSASGDGGANEVEGVPTADDGAEGAS